MPLSYKNKVLSVKITRVKLEWLVAQVTARETSQLTRYLCNRTPGQRADADAAGWTIRRIVTEGFVLTAPFFEKELVRGLLGILAGVKEASPEYVLPYVLKSIEESVKRTGRPNNADVLWLCKKYREAVETRRGQFGEDGSAYLAEIDAIEVMTS